MNSATRPSNSSTKLPILIYFDPVGQVLLNQGKIREALKSYRDLMALHPKEAVHHLQLAKAFLAAGLGETARSEAQTAVKLEPTSALAQKTLANILEYDSVSRRFRPGSDYTGAETAFRAAIKLDPDDKTNIANLAVLLEFNRWGLRYGPGARLKDALAEYRKLTPEKLAEFDMQNNIPVALFYDGQFAEARKSAEALNPQPLGVIVACEAALNGSQAALAEARKRTGQEEQFKQVASAAGQMLVNIRKYSVGADLEDAGASGDKASETAAYAALYRKTVPHEQIQFADDPAGVALRFEVLTSDPDLTLDQLRSIGSRNGAKAFAIPQVLSALVMDAKRTLSRKARNEDFTDVGLDLSLTRAQPKVEGNDAIGYKVTLWPSATYKSRTLHCQRRRTLQAAQHLWSRRRYRAGGPRSGYRQRSRQRACPPRLVSPRPASCWGRRSSSWRRLCPDVDERQGCRCRFYEGCGGSYCGVRLYYRTKRHPHPRCRPQVRFRRRREIQHHACIDHCYDTLQDYEKSFLIGAALAKQYPESESLFVRQEFSLRALGRFDEANALAEDRLKRLPGDLAAMRGLAYSAEMRGDYVKAQASLQKIIDAGQAEPQDLNGSSWNSLYTGKTEPVDLENALKAAQLSNNSPNILHTLGCVYAELGKTKEAGEVLVQAMDALNLDEPDENYWYAFGRIAEQYGERDVAIADYNRVSKPKQPFQIPTSSYRLAQMHLQDLHSSNK